jgi:HSP20 family protein
MQQAEVDCKSSQIAPTRPTLSVLAHSQAIYSGEKPMNLIPRAGNHALRHVNDDFAHYFSRLFDRLPSFGQADSMLKGDWVPAVDIEEQPEQFVISVEVPGIDPKDIEVTAQDGVLTIKGERQFKEEKHSHGMRTVERSYGRFTRSFSLPSNVATKSIKADSKQGVLHINLPKVEPRKPERIKVES